jgi:hypothetical protein
MTVCGVAGESKCRREPERWWWQVQVAESQGFQKRKEIQNKKRLERLLVRGRNDHR